MAILVSKSLGKRDTPSGHVRNKLMHYKESGDIIDWEYHYDDTSHKPGVFLVTDFWGTQHLMTMSETKCFILGMACVVANYEED